MKMKWLKHSDVKDKFFRTFVSTGKFCDTLVTLEALKPSEEKSFMSSSCNFTKEKVWLELTLLFNTNDSNVPLYSILFTVFCKTLEVHVKNSENSMWNVKIHKLKKPSKEMWQSSREVSLEYCHWCLERMLKVIHCDWIVETLPLRLGFSRGDRIS